MVFLSYKSKKPLTGKASLSISKSSCVFRETSIIGFIYEPEINSKLSRKCDHLELNTFESGSYILLLKKVAQL
jgi:hypothetical protein